MEVIASLKRSRQIGYHCAEAELWLAASKEGGNTTPLSYAAFELRLEIERIAVELLVRVQGGRLYPEDVHSLGSFKRLEDRIYQLAGHQRLIDRKLEFVNLMFTALKIDRRVPRINVGELKEAWHDCSKLCHNEWSLVSDSPTGSEVAKDAFGIISEIQKRVRSIVDAGITWLNVADASFKEIQDQYVNGDIDADRVNAWFADRGLWGTVTEPDGTTRFVGTAIPPRAG
jgi:hypothetical protein